MTSHGVSVTVADATIRATDGTNNAVEVETVGWDRPAPELSIPFLLDASLSGRATRLSAVTSHASVGSISLDGTIVDRRHLDANSRIEVSGAGTLVWLTAPINTWIRFDGPGTIERRGDTELVISFSHPTAVTLGFLSTVNAPRHAITVPPSPAGIATAISRFSASYTDPSPQRTSSLCRGHPPRIEYGEAVEVPPELRDATPTTGIELAVPPSLEALLPVATLATYLGASVTVEDRDAAVLRAPAADLAVEFSPAPTLQFEAAALLRRVFFLDMLVRWAVQSDDDWIEFDALAVLDLDPADCVELPIAARVARYRSVDFDRVSALFPEWHSSLYVEPTTETARALPSLVADMSQCYLASARPDAAAGAEATVPASERFALTRGGSATGRVAGRADRDAFDAPRPRTRGPHVGWLGADPLPGTYRALPDAYRNRARYLGERDELSIAVVCNDPDRTATRDLALSEYRVDEPASDVAVHEDLSREELRSLIAEGADLLHFVGPCRDGLACSDGTLRPGDLDRSAVRTLFLDGPGSLRTARRLLPTGSVAGAAWAGDLDEDAAGLRRTFLRSFVGGLPIDQARRYAAAYSPADARLAVLGDGLHVLPAFDQLQVFPLHVDPLGDGDFRVRIPTRYTAAGVGFGGVGIDHCQFGGNEVDLTLDAPAVSALFDVRRYVVVSGGEVLRHEDVGFFPFV